MMRGTVNRSIFLNLILHKHLETTVLNPNVYPAFSHPFLPTNTHTHAHIHTHSYISNNRKYTGNKESQGTSVYLQK